METIRIVHVIRRAQGMSRSAFEKRWCRHSGHVHSHADTLGLQGYTRLHTVPRSPINLLMRLARDTMPPFDGVESWWLDRRTFETALEQHDGREALQAIVEAERGFMDLTRSASWVAREHLIRPGELAPDGKRARKLCWVGSGLSSLSTAEFQGHYLHRHGPLVSSHAERIGLDRYLQLHTQDDPLNQQLQAMRGGAEPYAVHAELSMNPREMLSPQLLFSREAREAGAAVRREIAEDEDRHIDFRRSAIWMSEEHIVLPPPSIEVPGSLQNTASSEKTGASRDDAFAHRHQHRSEA